MTREKARTRLREAKMGVDLSTAEFESVADKVAIAALKIVDLINFRGTSYVFDLKRFTSFEGKTGPYLLYATVRIKSILRKATELGLPAGWDSAGSSQRARASRYGPRRQRELPLHLLGIDAPDRM